MASNTYTVSSSAAQHNFISESTVPTAVATPVESKAGSANASLYEKSIDLTEKGESDNDGQNIAAYVVPVLDKGVKSALTKPVSRWTKFRVWYNPYRQMYTFVLTLNLVGIVVAAAGHFPYARERAAAIALGNVLACVAIRSELFLRGVFILLVALFQKWTPLSFRIGLTAFLQHLGGIHTGAATSSLAWLIYATVLAFRAHGMNHPAVLAFAVIASTVVSVVIFSALPPIRERHHNVFEFHHRFAGWFAVACVWIFVGLSVSQQKTDGHWAWSGHDLVHAQQFWFTLFVTLLIATPWMTVRKVPVEITTPSERTAIVKFQRGIQQGLLGRISRAPVGEYHGFGIISEGIESNCHYMIVGVQGDWTRKMVTDKPTHLYTREMKFAGLPYLAHLYKKGICICTGSGIGAVLSTCVQLDNWFLIWIGSDMQKTFGPILFDIIERRIPKERYIVFDTKKEGRRPDTVKMLKDIYKAFEAEVVIITSNPKGNAELMQACRENNVPSFGPLWDS